MGVTWCSESDIQLAVEKVKPVLGVIKKTRCATGAKLAEPKSQPAEQPLISGEAAVEGKPLKVMARLQD